MTNTEFITRDKQNLIKATQFRITLVDGALVVAFLAVFLGVVFLLAK